MKITKQGVDPKTKLLKATCRNCGSEYEFTIMDPLIKTVEADQRDPRDCGYKWFPCQICAAQVIVNSH